MKIFVSNTILNFKTYFIPYDCIILSFQKFKINQIIKNINSLNPSSILCENKEVYNILKPYFKKKSIYICNCDNSDGVQYIPNLFKQNIIFIITSSTITLFIYYLFISNFTPSFLIIIINFSLFLIILLSYSDLIQWNNTSKQIIYS